MDGQGGILRLCRLCLVKDKVNIPIFEQQGDTRQIFLKISSCLAVKISREDKLPKNICEGCSDKLDSIFEFWNSSANAEKTLLSWLEQEEEKTGLIDQIPIEGLVKEETETLKNVNNETDPLPRKRARHTAAVKAQINITQELEDLITTQSLTKMEDESEVTDGEDKDPSYTEIPDNSDEDHQAGPSGVGKDGVESSRVHRLQQQFLCNECGKKFSKRKSLVAHITRHDRRKKGISFSCDACGNTFLDKKTVEIHKRKAHLDDYQYCCHQCGKPFVCTSQLNYHLKSAHAHMEFPSKFRCEVNGCQETFNRKATLRYHLSKHSGTTYTCGSCPRTFQHPYRLRIHIRKYHENQPSRLFQCTFCPLSLTTKLSLRDHIRVHTGEKPYRCDHCERHFRTSQQLKTHKVVHTKEKPFLCRICSKRFTQRGSLTIHIRSRHCQKKEFGNQDVSEASQVYNLNKI